jgi:D-tyrosyl-tRNA(Tyr) deacylase
MIALIQRVACAQVDVAGQNIAKIDVGLLALIGIRPDDDLHSTRRLLERLLGYRVFSDAAGRMNLSLKDIGGGLLLVPQFTLAADTRKGMRPGFSTAATPEAAQPLFEALVAAARAAHSHVAVGPFGAHMEVTLVNDGPVTFWLDSAPVSG